MNDVLIYGAYGYTGELVAERAVATGLDAVLAGRSDTKLRPLAKRLRLPHRAFALDNPAGIDRALEGIRVVAHCAGPFSRTAKPMVDACLRRGVHYLDITGEISVFEALRGRDDEAARAGVMLLPGVGMDVVPSDCLALHVARRVTDPARLALAIHAKTRASRGTTRTMLEGIVGHGAVRRAGMLESVPMFWKKRVFAFNGRRRICATFPLGELVTSYHSTGIGYIETYIALPRAVASFSPMLRYLLPLLNRPPIRRFIERRLESGAAGLTSGERAKGSAMIVAEVEDGAGRVTRSTLHVPEPYTLTAMTAVLCARRALAAPRPGFQTPATAFGPDLVLEIDGVRREDNI